ncbi:hypothetical protein [Deinococcus misasensis]|uniref:hypothetical protein n=1 Tax=Deinococcus misasensis TaxID=392413 RepID=UPI00054EC57E|nr:hypothetical protein [Deinococcus misasensis]
MPLSPSDNQMLAVYVGPEAYGQWKALMTAQGINPEDVLATFISQMGDVRLVAATVLDSLADPSLEAVVESKNRGRLDTKGQCAEWRAKARELRNLATSLNLRTGMLVGMSSLIPASSAFVRSDPPRETGESMPEPDWFDRNRGGVGE